MSELDKILDAVNILQDFTLAQAGNKDALDRLSKKENLPEPLKDIVDVKLKELVKNVKGEAKPEEIKKMTQRYGKPLRDEYQTDDEFNKALEDYNAFVTDLTSEIRKAIETPIGEAIKKSLVPERRQTDEAPVDIMKMFKSMGDSKDFGDFIYKEDVKV